MARNKKVEILSHDGQVLHPITDGDCVIFPDGETLTHKLSEDEAVMYTPEVVNSSPMFKVGEGDTVDYSASVLDGAYQEAILKGQTYVNTIQEPSADEITLPTPFTEYERTQSKTFTEMNSGTFGINLVGQSYVNSIQEPSKENYVALGEALEFQNKKVEYTSNGQIKSTILKGQTLVNVDSNYTNNDFILFNNATINSDGWITITANGNYLNALARMNNLIKPSTKYLAIVEVKENTLNGNFMPFSKWGEDTCFTTNFQDMNNSNSWGISSNKTGVFKSFLTTKDDYTNATILERSYVDNTCTTGSITYRVMLIEYQEGMENWDIPFFRGMQSVTMSTELENVCSRYNSGLAKGGKTFTVGSINDRTLKLADVANIEQYNFKQNTKYLIQFKIANLNLDGLSSTEIRFYTSSLESGNCLFENGSHVKVSKNGIYRAVFTTTSVINTSSFEIKGVATEWENSTSTSRTLTISQIMCIEYQNGMENWDLPYFETTQLMKPFKVRTMSKNLCPVGKGQFFNCFFKAGTQFTLSTKDGVASNGGNIVFKDKDGNSMWLGIDSGTSISRTTLTKDAYQIVNQLNSEAIQYQLEEGTSVTSFAPREEKITSALEPITLRAIGNVKDTLDLSTGEYVQRIGEITVDGVNAKAKKWVINNEWSETSRRFDLDITGVKRMAGWSGATTIIKSDKINVFDGIGETNPQCNSLYKWDDVIVLYINNSTITTVDEANDWLKQNPIKVQYQLANPITRKISLEYPNLQTYQDITHVQSIAMDGTLIPNIYLPSDISYKTLLKPSTKYNLQLKQNVVNADNPLTVNVGGTEVAIAQSRTLITTPSTLTSETVSFTGKGGNVGEVMLIENSALLDGDIPYFEGIGDVHLGRVIENLCMANHTTVGGATSTGTLYSDKITSKITKTGSHVHIFQLTKNLENSKRYFIYCPYDYQYIIYGFRHEYNNSLSYTYQSCEGINKKYAIIKIDGNQQKNPYTHLAVGCHGNIPVDTTMTIRRPIICEYIDGMENWDWESIGYFTGTRNIGNEFMRIGNKNLFDGTFYNHYWSAPFTNGGSAISKQNSSSCASTCRIPVKKGLTYTLSGTNLNRDIITFFKTDDMNEKPFDGLKQTTFTSPYDGYIEWYISNTHDTAPVTNVQIEEASSATSYVAHKHNALYLPKDESIPLSWEQGSISYSTGGSWADATNNTNTTRIRTQLLDLEPNETYRVSYGGNGYKYAIGFYNNSNIGSSVLTTTTMNEYYFTTTKDVHKIGIVVTTSNDGNITPSALHQVRLEKVTDVHLRSVGSYKDELDLTRGVYVQRIGEITFDGSNDENWSRNSYSNNELNVNVGRTIFDIQVVGIGDKDGTIGTINDRLIDAPATYLYAYSASKGIVEGVGNPDGRIRITILKNRIASDDVTSFKQWLSQNPITVQYILKTPIEHKVHIPMKNESNQIIAKPNGIFTLPLMHSGNNHVDINSQIYPKVESRDYISYPVIASPSQQYTVFHNKVGSTDLTVNLCGASTTVNTHKNTITTPSTISQYELRLSGARNKVSNVCVFSGDYMNVNVPYVQGMMNAVNPIVKNVGKNLINFNNIYTNHIANGRLSIDKINQTITGTNDYNDVQFYVYLVQGKTYTFNANGVFSQGSPLQLLRGKIQGYQEYALVNTFNNNTTFTLKTETGWYTLHIVNIRSMHNIQLEESSTPSQYEPYKENNCKPDYGQIKLTKDMFEQGSFNELSSVKNYYETKTSTSHNLQLKRIRLIDPIPVKPNTKYIVKFNGLEDYDIFVAYFKNNERVGFEGYWKNKEFTTPSDCNQIVFVLKRKGDAQILVDDIDYSKLIFSKVDETIYLRSLPNGVRDELNLETGEYVQRIGEINIRDLSKMNNMVRKGGWDNGTYMSFDIITPDAVQNKTNAIITASNLFPTVIRNLESSESMKEFVTNTASGNLFVMIRKDRLLSADLNGFKQWLEDNDLVIQYELATPVIKQVDIHNYPHSYKDGHVIIENGDPTTSVPAQLTYKCVTNRSGQIQEHTEQVEKQERQINELETLILENIRQNQNRSQNFLTSLISTLEIEEE